MTDVLLIGDSIRMGYCEGVRKILDGKARVLFPSENCRYVQNIFMNLPDWVERICDDTSAVKVVHWNSGQWDAARFNGATFPLNSLQSYEEGLKHVQWLIHKMFPNAEVIYALTTPMNPDSSEMPVNTRTTEEIVKYNEVATRVMAAAGIQVNDLFTPLARLDSSFFRDFCHFTDKGNELLAQLVCDAIIAYI